MTGATPDRQRRQTDRGDRQTEQTEQTEAAAATTSQTVGKAESIGLRQPPAAFRGFPLQLRFGPGSEQALCQCQCPNHFRYQLCMRHAPPKKQKHQAGHCVWYNRRSGTWTETDIGSIRWFLHDACKGCHLPQTHRDTHTHSETNTCSTGRAQLPAVALTSCAEAEKKETYPNGRWFLKKGVEQVLKWRHRWITTPSVENETEGGANSSGSSKSTKKNMTTNSKKQKKNTYCISS